MSYQHHKPVDPDVPVNPDYEDKDLHLGTIQKFMVGTFLFTFACFFLMFLAHKYYKSSFIDSRGVATERQIPGPDQPLLQANELIDLEAYKALEHERLNTLTNLTDHAVIPVQAAMALMLQDQAFPVRVAAATVEKAPADHNAPVETVPAEHPHATETAPHAEAHAEQPGQAPAVPEIVEAVPAAAEPVAIVTNVPAQLETAPEPALEPAILPPAVEPAPVPSPVPAQPEPTATPKPGRVST